MASKAKFMKNIKGNKALKMASKAKFMKNIKGNEALAEILVDEQKQDEWISTNVVVCNLLFSGKIKGGIKKGCISTCCADSAQGKSLIGVNVLKTAQKLGMDCVIIDTENAFMTNFGKSIGINFYDIPIFQTSNIAEIKAIYATINKGLNREERKNLFVLFDSWGPLVTQQLIDKAEGVSSSADMGSTARFKNELANVINSYGNTNFITNHVYENIGQMYGEKFCIPGGKRLFFNSDAIMLGSSAAKSKDSDGNVNGKIITAGVKKGRSAKEAVKTKYRILHNGALDPFYGLLDEAIACGVVYKPKLGRYARTNIDVNKETGEVIKQWKESDLYCPAFWIPLYNDKTFVDYVESKFSFEASEAISTTMDIMDMIDGKVDYNLTIDDLYEDETDTEEYDDSVEVELFDEED